MANKETEGKWHGLSESYNRQQRFERAVHGRWQRDEPFTDLVSVNLICGIN
jgi:hypothetical protein